MNKPSVDGYKPKARKSIIDFYSKHIIIYVHNGYYLVKDNHDKFFIVKSKDVDYKELITPINSIVLFQGASIDISKYLGKKFADYNSAISPKLCDKEEKYFIDIVKNGKHELIDTREIKYLTAKINYTDFTFYGKANIVAGISIKEYSKRIVDPNFVRISRACIVNKRYVIGVYLNVKEPSFVLIKGNKRIPVSRRCVVPSKRIFKGIPTIEPNA